MCLHLQKKPENWNYTLTPSTTASTLKIIETVFCEQNMPFSNFVKLHRSEKTTARKSSWLRKLLSQKMHPEDEMPQQRWLLHNGQRKAATWFMIITEFLLLLHKASLLLDVNILIALTTHGRKAGYKQNHLLHNMLNWSWIHKKQPKENNRKIKI